MQAGEVRANARREREREKWGGGRREEEDEERKGKREKSGEMANSGYLCGGKVGVVTGLEIATITLESQKRPTDQKINPPVDPMELDCENRPNPW